MYVYDTNHELNNRLSSSRDKEIKKRKKGSSFRLFLFFAVVVIVVA